MTRVQERLTFVAETIPLSRPVTEGVPKLTQLVDIPDNARPIGKPIIYPCSLEIPLEIQEITVNLRNLAHYCKIPDNANSFVVGRKLPGYSNPTLVPIQFYQIPAQTARGSPLPQVIDESLH